MYPICETIIQAMDSVALRATNMIIRIYNYLTLLMVSAYNNYEKRILLGGSIG